MSRQRSTQSQEQQRDNQFRQQHNRELHSLQINANRRVSRRFMNVQLERAAFQYDSTIDYSGLPCMQIGEMNVICEHCNAMKFRTEAPGLCCARHAAAQSTVEGGRRRHSIAEFKCTETVQWNTADCNKIDAECVAGEDFKRQIRRRRGTHSKNTSYSVGCAFSIQAAAVSRTIGLCNDNQQSTRSIVRGLWT